jgi:hypothetical protein
MTLSKDFARLVPLFGLLLVVQGCKKQPPPPTESPVKRGDSVVVEASAGDFFEGRVLEIDDRKVKVQTLTGDDLREVGLGDVYRISGAKWRREALPYGICNVGNGRWEGCQIVSGDGERSKVVTLAGKEQEVAGAEILLPTDVTALNLELRFTSAEARGRFEGQARAAGVPVRPSGWRPSHRERVLARRGEHWASARVESEADAGVGVLWEEQGRVTTLPSNEVVPLPPYTAAPPITLGGFALMDPEISGEDWVPVKIVSLTETDALVVNADGKEQRTPLRKLVALQR